MSTARAIDESVSQMACHECDLLVTVPPLAFREKAFCPRCNYQLAANRPYAIRAILAFALSGFLFLLLANAFPFIGFSASGQERTVSLYESVAILVAEDLPSLAFVVFASIILIPGSVLAGISYVSAAIIRKRRYPKVKPVLRWVLYLLPWSMAEIFLIGVLVSFIKIVSLADIALRLSFWSYVLFTCCTSIVVYYIDKKDLWTRLAELQHDG